MIQYIQDWNQFIMMVCQEYYQLLVIIIKMLHEVEVGLAWRTAVISDFDTGLCDPTNPYFGI